MLESSYDNDDIKIERTPEELRANLQNAKEVGKGAWEKVDFATKEKKALLIEGLKDFEAKTGIDESSYIKKIEKALNNGELAEIERKMNSSACTWYKLQIAKSGLYVPLHDNERAYIQLTLDSNEKFFAGLPLYDKNTSNISKISMLTQLEENLKTRAAVRTKIQAQSKFVQEEYFRRLPATELFDDKQVLLDGIIKEMEAVEKQPYAVQCEFKKAQQNSAKANVSTNALAKELSQKFTEKVTAYQSMILKNVDVFGGEKTSSAYGSIPASAVEFMDWFKEQKNFAEMDSALRKLPDIIEERGSLYEKCEKILSHAKPEDQSALRAKTKLMRRHTLEAFLPKLRSYIKNDNVHVAKFQAELLTANHGGIPIFNEKEGAKLLSQFKAASPESQAARLIILKDEEAERLATIKAYLKLDNYLRNDKEFMEKSAAGREQMLRKAQRIDEMAKGDPFSLKGEEAQDVSLNNKILGGEDVKSIADNLDSGKGEKLMDEIHAELEQNGLMKALRIQNETYTKVYGAAKRAEFNNENQKEQYMRDLRYWARLDQSVKTEKDVSNAKESSKLKFMQTADMAYDKNIALTSGGEVRDMAVMDMGKLKTGSDEAKTKLKNAKYGEHVIVKNREGQMAKDPLKMLEDMADEQILKLVTLGLQKLSGNKGLKLSGGNAQMVQNSDSIQKAMADQFTKKEFAGLKKQ